VQSAYRANHSTETAVLKVASDIFDSADTGHVTILALLDLSAAFDTVDHQVLLHRLSYTYGIGGTALRWFQSFLTGRSQTVSFAGSQSATSPLTCGVPQGSVCGRILFNLYTAHVVRLAHSFGVSIHCYADDLQLYIHSRPSEAAAAAERLLLCIEAIAGWMGSNRLKLNPDKTQIIWLGSRHQLAAVQVVPLRLHDGTIIAPSTSVRNLGVMLDCELSMAEHVNSIVRSCFYQLRQLRFVRHSLSEGTARMLVHAFVASRVDYCNSLLHGASQQTTRRLQAVLNASARLISGVGRHDHITAVLRDDLHWLPVTQRIEFKLALLVYKCLHGIGPDYLSSYCTALSEHDLGHHLRSASRGDLRVPRSLTRRLGPRSFSSSGPAVWNRLPAAIRDPSLTLVQFKRCLKQHFFCIAYER
jgi:hypothetical protein